MADVKKALGSNVAGAIGRLTNNIVQKASPIVNGDQQSTRKSSLVKAESDDGGQINQTMQLQSTSQNMPKDDNSIDGQQTSNDKTTTIDILGQEVPVTEEFKQGADQLNAQFQQLTENQKPERPEGIISETMELTPVEKDIDDQVNERFSKRPTGSIKEGTRVDNWFDNTTGQVISQADKDAAEAQMRDEWAKSHSLEAEGSPTGVAGAIDNVVLPGFNSIEGRDFSDAYNDYRQRSGLGLDEGQMVFEGDENAWRAMVQDEVMRDWYSDLYNADGTFNDDAFTDYFKKGRATSIDDIYNVGDGGYYSAGDYFGTDADTLNNIFAYMYDNGITDGYENMSKTYSTSDRDSVIKALAYEYLANEAAKTKASVDAGGENDFGARFSVNDINALLGDDLYNVGLVSDGYQTSDELGLFNNPVSSKEVDDNGNVVGGALYTPAWNYKNDELGRVVPVQNAIDNVLALLGDEYGARAVR